MANYQTETGYQLFARLNTSYNLENIYPELIPNNGPKQREVIEIFGESSTGKTIIISEIIAKCILPPTFENININGKNSGAIIINTDHHFHVFKLIEIMEKMLKNCNIFSSYKINDIINNSLNNLLILNCFNSQQLQVTIRNLENIISNNTNISLLVLDSITAYYWSDRLNTEIKKIELYQKSILKLLQIMTKDYKVVIVYTKNSALSHRRDFIEAPCNVPTLEKINYSVNLKKYLDNKYTAEITLPDNTKMVKFYLIKDLVGWLNG